LASLVSNLMKRRVIVNHDKIQEKLLLWLDGELPRAETEQVRQHLGACPECAGKLGALEREWKAARESGRVEPPPFLAARIATRIREYARNRHFLSDLTESLGRVAQRAALVLLLAGAVAVGIYLGGSPAKPSGKTAPGGPSYLGMFDDLPAQSVGGAYARLTGTAK
jgi:anti-sigma factor RsiW